ncbi:hypothetical protein OG906_40695 (plasmid) [Streptomyces sp. NBC_01426]|uniref:hypothetical protein n=1 Tax=Streptomyces sp. NBC_01426 TaxID=2975866 RepID=UPI002E30A403|nr:hypothetical protein [Streptomyces sp. NBC_01426]
MLDLRHQLIEGRADVPRVGSVIELDTIPWYAVVGPDETVVAPVVPYLRGLTLDDNRPPTAKSYAYDLTRHPAPPPDRRRDPHMCGSAAVVPAPIPSLELRWPRGAARPALSPARIPARRPKGSTGLGTVPG